MDGASGEWLTQAEYDMDTAEYMFDGGRFVYAVFMCHLSVEKALKGLFLHSLNRIPPKTHSLVYLLSEIGVTLPEELGRFIVRLNEASIVTRYPETLAKIQGQYPGPVVRDILDRAKGALEWIRAQF